MSFVNSINNPDKLDPTNSNYATDSKNMISSTFDGRIVSTTRTYFVKYSTQAPALDRIFTSAGKEKTKHIILMSFVIQMKDEHLFQRMELCNLVNGHRLNIRNHPTIRFLNI